PVLTGQAFIGDDAAHGIFRRQDARGTQRVGDAPGVEVLHRALRQILPLRNAMRRGAALDQRAGYPAQPEVDGERHADRPSAHDDDLVALAHSALIPAALMIGPHFSIPALSMAASVSGVCCSRGKISWPRSASRARTTGSAKVSTTAALSRATMGAGVPLGA